MTSNSKKFPTTSELIIIAKQSQSKKECRDLLKHVFKKLQEKAKKWRKIIKTLNLIKVILTHGSLDCVTEIKKNLFLISELQNFSFMEGSMDRGVKIRDMSEGLNEKIDNLDLNTYKNNKVSENKFQINNKFVKSEIRSRSVIGKKDEVVKSMTPLDNYKSKKKKKFNKSHINNEGDLSDLGLKKSFLKFDNILSRNSSSNTDKFLNGKQKVSEYSKVDFSKLNELNFETKREKKDNLKFEENVFYNIEGSNEDLKQNKIKDGKKNGFGSYKRLDEINFETEKKIDNKNKNNNKFEDVDFLNF